MSYDSGDAVSDSCNYSRNKTSRDISKLDRDHAIRLVVFLLPEKTNERDVKLPGYHSVDLVCSLHQLILALFAEPSFRILST